MSNLWINIRIGTRHLKVGPSHLSFKVNPYLVGMDGESAFKIFEFFWYQA